MHQRLLISNRRLFYHQFKKLPLPSHCAALLPFVKKDQETTPCPGLTSHSVGYLTLYFILVREVWQKLKLLPK